MEKDKIESLMDEISFSLSSHQKERLIKDICFNFTSLVIENTQQFLKETKHKKGEKEKWHS